jgi:uncharacterized protein YegL
MNTIKQRDVQNKKAKVFVSVVLDESSSMSTGKDAIVSGMNEQIQTLKKKFEGDLIEPVVSFIKFSDSVVSLYEGKTIGDLSEFDPRSYNPNGMTALYDAVGYTIDMMQRLDGINDEGNSCLLIIITDGEENSSHRFNSSQISEKISTLNKTGKWTVTYLGPNNVDLTKVNQHTKISYGNMYSADLTSNAGYVSAFKSMNQSLGVYASNVSTNAASGCLSFASDSFYLDSKTGESESKAGSATVNSMDNQTAAKVP